MKTTTKTTKAPMTTTVSIHSWSKTSPSEAYVDVIPGVSVTLRGFGLSEDVAEHMPCVMHQDCEQHEGLACACRAKRIAEGDRTNARPFVKVFELGDEIVFDSFNLIYTARIQRITAKTIEVMGHSKVVRLSLAKFAEKNWNFDAARIAHHNRETSMCI